MSILWSLINNNEDALFEAELRMDAAVEHLQSTFSALRTGGANTGVLNDVKVECYGGQTDLRSVALITAPDKRNLIVRPFDVNILPEIEKALLRSKVGLTPFREGKLIRLPVPPLTDERRVELSIQAKSLAEGQKVAIRNIRRDLMSLPISSEDVKRVFTNQVDTLTKTYIAKIDEALKSKLSSLVDLNSRWNPDQR